MRTRQFESLAQWQQVFSSLSQAQLDAMTKDVSASAELRKENLSVLWRTWADVGRQFESDEGTNTTDMTFFAIAPSAVRGTGQYTAQPASSFVPFPALKSPNYFDVIDVLPNTDHLRFLAKNRAGVAKQVTLAEFLENIGSYISDLDEKANWSDAIDRTPLQLGSQCSLLPVPSGRADIGVAVFGQGCVNLHIVVGPQGDLGWAPENPKGGKRIFFRSGDGKELRAISLVPEQRTSVKKAFFKVEVHQESVEEEKQRYVNTQNRLLHLQIEMDLPKPIAPPKQGKRNEGKDQEISCSHEMSIFPSPSEGSHT